MESHGPSKETWLNLAFSALLPAAWLLLPYYYTYKEPTKIWINGSLVIFEPEIDRRAYLVLWAAVIPHLIGWFGAYRLLTATLQRRIGGADIVGLFVLFILLGWGLRPLAALLMS